MIQMHHNCCEDDDHCHEQENNVQVHPYKKSANKIGRNDPCLCGSGKKYKKCCLQQNVDF